jgi:hypothetical protein
MNAWKTQCTHPFGCIVISKERGGSYCRVCRLEQQILMERRNHRQQLIRLALENADLEDRIVRLEEMLDEFKVRRPWST